MHSSITTFIFRQCPKCYLPTPGKLGELIILLLDLSKSQFLPLPSSPSSSFPPSLPQAKVTLLNRWNTYLHFSSGTSSQYFNKDTPIKVDNKPTSLYQTPIMYIPMGFYLEADVAVLPLAFLHRLLEGSSRSTCLWMHWSPSQPCQGSKRALLATSPPPERFLCPTMTTLTVSQLPW